MPLEPSSFQLVVHCRIGSLEICVDVVGLGGAVHCRIGSLEKSHLVEHIKDIVHCRIGSLEIRMPPKINHTACSLPYRQFRN